MGGAVVSPLVEQEGGITPETVNWMLQVVRGTWSSMTFVMSTFVVPINQVGHRYWNMSLSLRIAI